MRLKKQIEKCEYYSGKPKSEIPWEVLRVFPNMDIGSTGISFSPDGDFVTREEAIFALEYLLNELK